MKAKILSATLLSVMTLTSVFGQNADSSFYFTPKPESNDVTPAPGSVSATLSVQSLNNILQLAAPLAANEIFQNKTFNINYKKKGFLKIYNI